MSEAAEDRDTIRVIGPAPDLDPSRSVVDELEALLVDARRGDLRTIAFAACYVGGDAVFGVRGDGERVNIYSLVGQLEALKHHALDKLPGGAVDFDLDP